MCYFLFSPGLVIYFAYGMRHSKENVQIVEGPNRIFPMIDLRAEPINESNDKRSMLN